MSTTDAPAKPRKRLSKRIGRYVYEDLSCVSTTDEPVGCTDSCSNSMKELCATTRGLQADMSKLFEEVRHLRADITATGHVSTWHRPNLSPNAIEDLTHPVRLAPPSAEPISVTLNKPALIMNPPTFQHASIAFNSEELPSSVYRDAILPDGPEWLDTAVSDLGNSPTSCQRSGFSTIMGWKTVETDTGNP